MRQAEAIPVTVEDEAAQKLLERISPRLHAAVLEAIHSTRQGVDVKSIVIRSIKSWEEPGWEELNFDVRVDAELPERSAYWDRIGSRLDELMDEVDRPDREHLIKLVSVYVTSHGI